MIRFVAGVFTGSLATVAYSIYAFRKMTNEALVEVLEQHDQIQQRSR